uniref:ASCH domain-containing protein n=1 Tax=Noccaea caerulescens TaxID=107243 RepID=A0A1J3J009_NOCCA
MGLLDLKWITLDGIKTVEARCFEAEYDRLQQRGSMVMINKCLMFEVLEVHKFPSFYELLKAESPEKVLPGVETVDEGMQMFRELYDVDPEKISGVVAIHLTKSVVQPCVALAHILSGLSYTGVQSLLGLSHTIGSIFHALPPPRSILHSSFMLPYRPKVKGSTLSHGARALAKHVDRSSDRFWGVLHGDDSDKNRLAMDICDRFISQCCWMNVHIVPTHGEVFEIRVAQGYGARWSRDGTKFIGFLEPYSEDGHSMAWKH